ncbi:hypothetical protein M878_05345 [Streptomyces roseochromogenus subsp. oscitans DS 12.976]|uniref:Uncharacterized protein n=2 Tax=Streptomyces roseochromogenus TaxID=285450 RepID=V6KVL8_STRRC|nr:hypothetical protein M878_05345 [Streptomyces roseochromogenus subsp. oscitans DS 12.976]
MPPQMVGGQALGPVVMARSGRGVVVVRQVLAFPTGVLIEVEAHGRGTWSDSDLDGSPLRFSIRFGDGRVAVLDDDAGLRNGQGPMLHAYQTQSSGGGPDASEEIQMSLWLWPLPPAGPVGVTCSWVSAGIGSAELVLDGDALCSAAEQAEPFWPAQ